MIKRLNVSGSPATAAAGSAVLILAALVGVILAAGAAAEPPSSVTSSTSTSALNGAPLVLPKPCVITKNHQTCDAAATKTHRAKQVKKQPAQGAPPAASPAIPIPTSP